MVSTRRSSRSTAGVGNSADHHDDVAETLSQPEVPCRRTRRTSAAAVTHAVLQPVVEEPAGGSAAASQEDEDIIPTQELPQHNEQQAERQQQLEQQSQQQQRPRREPAPEQQPQHVSSAQQSQQQLQQHEAPAPVQAASDGDNDSGSDDWDFDGPDMLQILAASIRAALGTTAGNKQQKHAAAVGDNEIEDATLRWRPTTGLQLPPRIGQLVHRAAAALPAQQQQELAVAGPQVANPAAAAAAAADASADVPTQATGAAVTKPKGLAKHTRVPTLDPTAAAKAARQGKPDTAGKKWYGLPAVKVTEEVKKDLRLLRLRGAYDPKRFYKSFDDTKFPKHFAIGTVVDDPLDYYGGRLSKGQRKASLTEQLLADTELTHSRKKRYSKLQEDANKWVKHKKRKTDMPRKTPSKHRPRH